MSTRSASRPSCTLCAPWTSRRSAAAGSPPRSRDPLPRRRTVIDNPAAAPITLLNDELSRTAEPYFHGARRSDGALCSRISWECTWAGRSLRPSSLACSARGRRTPAPDSISDKSNILVPDTRGAATKTYPHGVLFLPATEDANWGANAHGSPIFAATGDAEPITTFFVVGPTWSDGTLGP